MYLKMLVRLLLILTILTTGAGAYLLFIMNRLPWQRPAFDTAKPVAPQKIKAKGILIFSKTNGYRHKSISAGIKAITQEGEALGWNVSSTDNGAHFTPEHLQSFKVVVFLSTTGAVLTPDQKSAFERFIENGGGFAGIHAATDTEYDWSWYARLLGTHFQSHTLLPQHTPKAEIKTEVRNHPATRHLPEAWFKEDEWYNFKENVRGKEGIQVLLTVNEDSYPSIWPKRMGKDHPISWTNTAGKGRMFYTGLGHTSETFSDTNSLQHIIGGIGWAGRL